MTWRSRGGKELEELQERKKKKERKEKWEEWRRTRKVNNSHEGSSWEKEVASCNLWTKRNERNRDRLGNTWRQKQDAKSKNNCKELEKEVDDLSLVRGTGRWFVVRVSCTIFLLMNVSLDGNPNPYSVYYFLSVSIDVSNGFTTKACIWGASFI